MTQEQKGEPIMEWPDSWRDAFRIELRAQAIALVCRGWPVMPGTYPNGSDWVGGAEIGRSGPRPVPERWLDHAQADPVETAEWWNEDTYSLLVATGTVVDAIEVGDDVGRHAAAVLRRNGLRVPIAASPEGRWFFLTQPGRPLRAELAEREDVVLHTTGGWIPLPPTAFPHGVMHWRVRPEDCGWRLLAADAVQYVVLRATIEAAMESVAGQRFVDAERTVA